MSEMEDVSMECEQKEKSVPGTESGSDTITSMEILMKDYGDCRIQGHYFDLDDDYGSAINVVS